MPLETLKKAIYVRTYLNLVDELGALPPKNGSGRRPPVVIVCNNARCNQHTRDSEFRVVVLGDFRCWECFKKLVRNQKLAFDVSEEATEEEIKNLLKPFEQPIAPNLYEPKKTPGFVCI